MKIYKNLKKGSIFLDKTLRTTAACYGFLPHHDFP